MKPNWWWINKHCQFKWSKLSQNCPWLQHGYMCTSWNHVTWLFLRGNRYSNHCDVTVRFVTLNSNCTLNIKIGNKISIIILGKQIKINQNVLGKMLFWKYKLFRMVTLPHSKHTSDLLDICHHHIDSHLFPKAFSRLSLNLTMEPFK